MLTIYKELLERVTKGGYWQMIVVDGVVGVGKSTFMNILSEKGYIPYPEPVLDNPLLEKFYYDRARYSFPLQVFFLNKRFKFIKDASEAGNAVMDRSIYGDVIFAKMLKDNGEMSDEEFELYKELLSNMLEHVKPPKLMVYLEISVDGAMNRIEKRGRDYEQIVERAYWERLNHEYKTYFESYDISPILTINVDNLDFENNENDKAYVLSLIESKLNEIA